MSSMRQIIMADLECPSCGVPFSIPQNLVELKRETEDTFVCPNGHECFPHKPDDPPLLSDAKKRDILAAHEAEQREARESDMARRESAMKPSGNRRGRPSKQAKQP